MNFLSIDCCTDRGSLFLKVKNKSFCRILQSDKFNNDLLMSQISDFFKENNLSFDDISQVFVNQGPGNFSILRSSLAIAKGICLAKNLKLFGYDTFLLLAAKFLKKYIYICIILIYRNKYFIKNFSKDLLTYKNPKEIEIDEILKKHKNSFKIILKNDENYFDKRILDLNNINIVNLDYTELTKLKKNYFSEKSSIKPIYLS